jgi:hypothetical protein
MKQRDFVQSVGMAAVVLLAATANTMATVTMALTDATTLAESGFVANLPGGGTLTSGELIGLYKFTPTAGDLGTTPFWSTCLSPGGNLDYGSYTYNIESFAAAWNGLHPSAWAGTTSDMYGILNAAYLWQKYGAGVANANQGAGLALAMYKVLYDSTGDGTYGAGGFAVTSWGGHTAAQTAYNNYLAGLLGTSPLAGSILVPTNPNGPGSGQEFILIPEVTTMIAGAMLLLPFGASTLRYLRKNRAA